VTFTCFDALSGIVACPPAAPLAAEGAGQAVTGSVSDRAGNTASASVTGINIDMTPPATVATAPSGWQSSDVTVTLAATDQLSGLKATYFSVDGGPVQAGNALSLTLDGIHTITYWSEDIAGNMEQPQSLTVQIDRSGPTISHVQAPLPNADGWNNTPVTVTFTCWDSVGIASCTGPITLTAEGQNQVVTGTAVDLAGNTATDQATVNIDQTAPTVTYAGNLGTYTADQPIEITCTAADNLSGVKSSTCEPITIPANTLTPGTYTFSATATDYAGNTGTGSVTFTVTAPPDGTCALIDRWVPHHGVANSLCVKIRNSMAAKERGSYGAAFNLLEAFKREVEAQDDEHILPGGREALLQLADTLEANLPPDARTGKNK
jgi:hypothetical protein